MLYREYLKMDYPIKDGLNKYRGLTGNDINFINNNKLISGATILGDGEVALILDVNTLM